MQRTDRILARQDGTDAVVEDLAPVRETAAVWEYEFDEDAVSHKLYRQGRVATWTVDDLGLSGHQLPERWLPIQRDLSRVPHQSPFYRFSSHDWDRWDNQVLRYMVSQTLHGEHMGVLCGAALTEAAPSWDVKMFAATQTADEARHLEAVKTYVDLMGGEYPVNGHLHSLFQQALTSRDWDMIYIAAQVMVEGMGLGAFSWIAQEAADAKLSQLMRYIMTDEARHVAFGVHRLSEVLAGLTHSEIRHRLEFVNEVAQSLVDRLIPVAVARECGVDERQFVKSTHMSPSHRALQLRVFSHVGPICQRLGLLDADGGWLRVRFEEIGLLDEVREPPRRSRTP